MCQNLDVILDLLSQTQVPLAFLTILLATVSLGSTFLGLLGYWTIRPDHYASEADFLQRRKDLRSIGIPAFFAVISGFLISISSALLLDSIRGGGYFWAPLDWAVCCLLMAIVTVVLALILGARVRIDVVDWTYSAARIRVSAADRTGETIESPRFVEESHRKLREADRDIAREVLPLAGAKAYLRIGSLIEEIAPDRSLTMREALSRPNRHLLLRLQVKLLADSASRLGWPVLVPLSWVLWGWSTGTIATAGGDPRLAWVLAGIGLIIGIALVAAKYWVDGVCAFRRIAARKYEVKLALDELEQLQLRIDAHRRRGVRGLWRRLVGQV